MTANYDFTINQGSDVSLPILLKDCAGEAIDLTGYSIAMQIRRFRASETAIDTLESAGDRIEMDATAGKFTLRFPHEITETYPVAKLVYDIEITSGGGEITRVLQGAITVSGEVTRV